MGFLSEFKKFAAKGNVIDLAVGVIIGGAFGKITNSLVTDVIMPPVGLLIDNIDFKKIKWQLKPPVMENGEVVKEAVSINIGQFINTTIDFLIIAIVIFLMVRTINQLKHKEEQKSAPPPGPTETEKLLMEIRDELKKK